MEVSKEEEEEDNYTFINEYDLLSFLDEVEEENIPLFSHDPR